MNNLYGPKFIEKQRSSGYKSTIYAMAEIVDNSVDAKATQVDLVFVEKEVHRAARASTMLHEIYFLDNGNGMTLDRINKCLTFSEGEGKNDSRIGAFGVGLPNSSISVGRRVEVYSKDENDRWNYVFLDLDDQLSRQEPNYDAAIQKVPKLEAQIKVREDIRTIVVWSKLDLVDVSYAKTLINRAQPLLGRIYRYNILNGFKITVQSFLTGNQSYDFEPEEIIPYDPLFVSTKKTFITEKIWHYSENEDKKGKHISLGDNPEFNSMYHYRKFTEGCERNHTNKPLFQQYDEYWDVPYKTALSGKVYKWRIKASFAHASIANPGIRSGGGTELGKLFGHKMSGKAHFKSGNIFFVRANREIDFGNFGLYAITDEKNRFWTIEIHFDSDLDNLLGVSNTKQTVDFWAAQRNDLEYIDRNEELPEGTQREILYSEITYSVSKCIKDMRRFLSEYARNFRDLEKARLAEEKDEASPVPQAEPAVIEVIPKGEPWTDDEKTEIGKFLKSKYMHLTQEIINAQVDIFAKGLTRTLVLYTPNETNNLFEIKEIRGKLITLINTNHVYYTNIIEPLKSSKLLKVFAIAIEMFISSAALEMDRLIIDNSDKYEAPLNNYLLQLSSRLNEFITDSHIKVVTADLEKALIKELELDEE